MVKCRQNSKSYAVERAGTTLTASATIYDFCFPLPVPVLTTPYPFLHFWPLTIIISHYPFSFCLSPPFSIINILIPFTTMPHHPLSQENPLFISHFQIHLFLISMTFLSLLSLFLSLLHCTHRHSHPTCFTNSRGDPSRMQGLSFSQSMLIFPHSNLLSPSLNCGLKNESIAFKKTIYSCHRWLLNGGRKKRKGKEGERRGKRKRGKEKKIFSF